LDYTENGNTDDLLKFVLSQKLNIVNLRLARPKFFWNKILWLFNWGSRYDNSLYLTVFKDEIFCKNKKYSK